MVIGEPRLTANTVIFNYNRQALKDSLERAFVPALAAVISFIDVRRNLVLLDVGGPMSDIWLRIFKQCHNLGLQVDPLTLVSTL